MSKDEKKGASPTETHGYALDNFRHKRQDYRRDDIVAFSPDVFAALSAQGLVGTAKPLAAGEIELPEGRPEIVKAVVRTSLRRAKKDLGAGTRVDLPFAEYVSLAQDGVVGITGLAGGVLDDRRAAALDG